MKQEVNLTAFLDFLHIVSYYHPIHNTYALKAVLKEIKAKWSRQDFKGQGQYAKVTRQINTTTLHTYTPIQCPYQVSTFYILWFLKYSPDKIFKVKVTTARLKFKSRSHRSRHCAPSPPTNVPTKQSEGVNLTCFLDSLYITS